MINKWNQTLVLPAMVLLLVLTLLPGIVHASVEDSDTLEFDISVPMTVYVMFAEENGNVTWDQLTPLSTVTFDFDEDDLLYFKDNPIYISEPPSDTDTRVQDHGFVHGWANTNFTIAFGRTDNDFSDAGIELWLRIDGYPFYWKITTDPANCDGEEDGWWGGSIGHANANLRWLIKGVDHQTPAGTYTETVTAYIYEDQ
jgi:hypothetical protein